MHGNDPGRVGIFWLVIIALFLAEILQQLPACQRLGSSCSQAQLVFESSFGHTKVSKNAEPSRKGELIARENANH